MSQQPENSTKHIINTMVTRSVFFEFDVIASSSHRAAFPFHVLAVAWLWLWLNGRCGGRTNRGRRRDNGRGRQRRGVRGGVSGGWRWRWVAPARGRYETRVCKPLIERELMRGQKKNGYNTALFPGGPPPQY
jgi:hypothetical protein